MNRPILVVRAHATVATVKQPWAASMTGRLPFTSAIGPEISGWMACPRLYAEAVQAKSVAEALKSSANCPKPGKYIEYATVET